MHKWRICVSSVAAALVAACATADRQDTAVAPDAAAPVSVAVRIPLTNGWYQGRPIQYITTDASDRDAAAMLGANYVPRLAYAVPESPREPGQPTATDRIYAVTNFEQDNVLPSAPGPVGPANTDRTYSPLWVVHEVTWHAKGTARTLRSEQDVLEAADKGLVSIKSTGIVVNCPIVVTATGGRLRGVSLSGGDR